MNRADLIRQLELYLPKAADSQESSHVVKTIDFVRRTPAAFERDHAALGHVTGSVLVASLDCRDVLLNQYGRTKMWMNFGGHCDGDEDVYATAVRELGEEAGITDAASIDRQIFDVDVHFIAAHIRQGEPVPAHNHYDIMYLGLVPRDVRYGVSHESEAIDWFTVPAALELQMHRPDRDAQMLRMLTKVQARQAA